jgi:tRNA uridine 5-carboxymethylaminomethyl modification enzyme
VAKSLEAYDVIVVGGGHAGCEAAMAAARMQARTALYTFDIRRLAEMSCNPAIGGIAKGHLVREIDALGGIMGKIADKTGIQFRLLNRSRGPAVQAPRCQSDKHKYSLEMRRLLESQPNLSICQSEVASLILEKDSVRGVRLQDGSCIRSQVVVITTGTFLNGLIHIGNQTHPAGRIGEAASISLARCFKELGFNIGRLKTGTPPRLDKDSIDYSRFEEQRGDNEPTFFSLDTRTYSLPQVSCHLGYTNSRVHSIIRANLKRSALYGGLIEGIGPRYCPSVEDKVVKFADRERHQIFLEPEGLNTNAIYLNGLSSSMPIEIQQDFIRAIPGLERSSMLRPGYAIEYDFVQPTELYPNLETKQIQGLFHAGQINGTTGYEEAAAQGLVAGINAALKIQSKKPAIFPREESFIGTLVDDLVTRGVDEPYRMFTSRSEFRLLLRIDNADRRLRPKGYNLGLVSESDYAVYTEKYREVERLRHFLKNHRWNPQKENCPALIGKLDSIQAKGFTLESLLRRPGITLFEIEPLLRSHGIWPSSSEVVKATDIEVRYEGYIQQQLKDVEKLQRLSLRRIPSDFDYGKVPGLSREVQEKLSTIRPGNLAMAGRIPGVTPAAITVLNIQLELSQSGRQTTICNSEHPEGDR